MIHWLIKNADSRVIEQRFLLRKKDDMDPFITVVPTKYHKMYIQRMTDDWSKGRVLGVFNNINMKIPEFRQRFMSHLNTLDIAFQRQLALTCDVAYKHTTLLLCCHYNDFPLIQWCIYHGVDVNQSNCNGCSPMLVSAYTGDAVTVKVLLNNNADINQCLDGGASPFYVVCLNNRIEIVKVLLDNKANIHKT
ncbi:unnamed protein product [Mytilus coruscus]|uniref:Uncharacterized protein n=1 Tax=Mytilus coruscus TaxID=42192 RepID=A0A6J8BB01_MYTCO|nr:unnamed protein product [Mytilus coruscus]